MHSGFPRPSVQAVAVSWNSPVAYGGQYRLCWCSIIHYGDVSSSNSCIEHSSFRTDVGRMEIIGLSPLAQDATCISGQQCRIRGFHGNHLSSNDIVLVADTCGSASVMCRFDGSISQVSQSGAEVFFGSVTAAGGLFRLCWCSGSITSASFACRKSHENFRVAIGTLTVLGPSPLFQDRTCISGRLCTLDNLTFALPTSGDSLLVLDTCGIDSVPDRSIFKEAPFSTTSILSSFSVGFRDMDGDGLTYCGGDLCYQDPLKIFPGVCGCGVSDADTDGDGTVDCLDWCPFDSNKTLPGHCGCGDVEDDSDGDGVLDCEDKCPLDPTKTNPEVCGCGIAETDSDIDGTPDCNDNCPSQPDSIAGTCQCAAAFLDDDGDGTPNCNDLCPSDPLKLAPGPGGCGTPDTDTDGDGVVDYLDLCPFDSTKTLPGDCGCNVADSDTDEDGLPDCVDGCPYDGGKNLSGICGCGTSDEDADGNRKADCLPDCPPDLEAQNAFVSRGSLGPAPMSVSGGQYRLCWCAGQVEANITNSTNISGTFAAPFSTCLFNTEYNVDMGGLMILGVSPLQQVKTCVTGLSCIIDKVTGYGLSYYDSYAVLDTCGLPSRPFAGIFSVFESSNFSTATLDATTNRWLSEDVIVYGGTYRLCWCADWNNNLTKCNHARDFRVDFGTLHMLGPVQSSWTCISGQTCVAAIQGVVFFEDTFLVLNSCGVGVSGPWPAPKVPVARESGESAAFRVRWDEPVPVACGEYRFHLSCKT